MRKLLIILVVLAIALVVFMYTSRRVSDPVADEQSAATLEAIDRDLNVEIEDGASDFQTLDQGIGEL